MPYETKPNTGTLFTNDRKQQETHPDYNGKLLISRELLEKLAGYGEAMIEVSAWIKETKAGSTIINLQCKEPYKKPVSNGDYSDSDRHNPDYTPTQPQPTAATKPQRSPQQLAEYKLSQLKTKLATIDNYPDFEALYNLVYEPDRWNVFKAVPAIAKEAAELLSKKKSELILATEPIDLSSIISKIDVELSRLNLPAKEHCLVRWNKARGQLSPDELQIYFDELAIAQPIKFNEFF